MAITGHLMHHRKPYHVNLVRQQLLCETNYNLLMKLMTSNTANQWLIGYTIHGQTHLVNFQIIDRSRYTTVIDIAQENQAYWLPSQTMHVVLYHDVRMAEVINSQRQCSFQPCYSYPNPSMYYPDEKEQINRFLAERLEHCLSTGSLFEENKHV